MTLLLMGRDIVQMRGPPLLKQWVNLWIKIIIDFSHILDSESLPELARLNEEMTTQISDNFVNLIQADDPSNTFIHIDYTKDTYEKRMAHALELGLGNNSIGWTFPLFNKGGSDANILSAYH